jgi:regulator of sirC expression with transglutaminase-like and TPR domain
MRESVVREFLDAAVAPDQDAVAPAALLLARHAYPQLDTAPYLAELDLLGSEAAARLEGASARTPAAELEVLNHLLFTELGFTGQGSNYEDPRNSDLNAVLDRRIGIPISLAVVYMETARRAGVPVKGVNFPGRFLLRHAGAGSPLVFDPFQGGILLSERDCEALLHEHADDEPAFDRALLAPATRQQILVRILTNLKRTYVRLRSFPQAREVTELLTALEPSSLRDLRDRGLLAYQLSDFPAALRDLQQYLSLRGPVEDDDEARQERDQIWEHVKVLRRRMASLN